MILQISHKRKSSQEVTFISLTQQAAVLGYIHFGKITGQDAIITLA